jgi:hypothetical protein
MQSIETLHYSLSVVKSSPKHAIHDMHTRVAVQATHWYSLDATPAAAMALNTGSTREVGKEVSLSPKWLRGGVGGEEEGSLGEGGTRQLSAADARSITAEWACGMCGRVGCGVM